MPSHGGCSSSPFLGPGHPPFCGQVPSGPAHRGRPPSPAAKCPLDHTHQSPPHLVFSPFHRSGAIFYIHRFGATFYYFHRSGAVLHSTSTASVLHSIISTAPVQCYILFPPLRCYILFFPPLRCSATFYFHRFGATFYYFHRSGDTLRYTPAAPSITLAAPTAPCPQTLIRLRAGLGADLAPNFEGNCRPMFFIKIAVKINIERHPGSLSCMPAVSK